MTGAKSTKRQTLNELRQLQRLAGAIIMRPLDTDWRMQRQWIDHRDMSEVAGEFIKPNDRLTSAERIEIYNKQYWFRLIDCMYDDFPGLRAILGRVKFNRFVIDYLQQFPSRSFTMRNLGSHLPAFVAHRRRSFGRKRELITDMVNFEWAQVIAFDGPALEAISVDSLLGRDPRKIRLKLQPYLVLRELRYAIDDFVLESKKDNLRGEASNAVDESDAPVGTKKSRTKGRSAVKLPRRRHVFVAVHRYHHSLYYKRLEPDEFQLLTALRDGQSLHKALTNFDGDSDPKRIQRCFETWASLGWFCKG